MEGTSEVQGKRKRTRPPRGAARRTKRPQPHLHPFEVRRKAVQLCLEESFPVERVAREMGVGRSTLSKWVRLYRDQGEAGLQSKPARRNRPRPKVASAVKSQAGGMDALELPPDS
jgi:transposase-like protein